MEKRFDLFPFRVNDYHRYLKKTGLLDRELARKTVCKRFTLVRKDLGKSKKDRLTFSEFAKYIDMPPKELYDLLKN